LPVCRCWARLSWHPDPQLLSEVARRFATPASLDALRPAELARGIWGLSALGALGAAELARLAPRVRELASELDEQQLLAVSRALEAATAPGEGAGGAGAADVAALVAELSARAEQLRSAGV
jgi:hypothetical protein